MEASPVSLSESDGQPCAFAQLNGGRTVLNVPLDVNVRHTFGSGSFLVHKDSKMVVSLDAHGRPVNPLDARASYIVFVCGARELRKQVALLRGQLRQTHDELTKLRQRVLKLDGCVHDEIEHVRTMLPGNSAGSAAVQNVDSSSMSSAAKLLRAEGEEHAEFRANTEGGAGISPAPKQPPRSQAASSQLRSTDRIEIFPIGHIHTPFIEKNGTPRQACLCPSARSELRLDLKLHGGLNASHALEGLSHFSHVWLLFLFDKNGHVATKSKVRPPRLDGIKTGLYSTRTPHRPNAIGLSLAQLHSVEDDVLHLGGADLVDVATVQRMCSTSSVKKADFGVLLALITGTLGTPILDVKPYVPFADTALGATVAPWLAAMPTPDLQVQFTPEATEQLRLLVPEQSLLRSEAQARSAITEVLTADPRSVHWRQSRAAMEFGFSIDKLNVVCAFDDVAATVTAVHHLHLSDRSHVARQDQAATDPENEAVGSAGTRA